MEIIRVLLEETQTNQHDVQHRTYRTAIKSMKRKPARGHKTAGGRIQQTEGRAK
jgi:hypothetical protein